MKMRIDEALFELGNIVGYDTLIIDNANEPAPIRGVLGSIVDAVGGYMDDITEGDYAISEDGITKIKPDGYLEQIPLYKVVPTKAPSKKYEITYYFRDTEKAKVEFETYDLHDDVWDALYAVVSEANPRDTMSQSNTDFVNNLTDLTWDETGFTACNGDVMIIAERV